MEPLILTALMTFILLLMIAIGVPIAFAMGITGGLGIVFIGGLPTVLYTLGTYPVSRAGTFALSVIPLFLLMGNLAAAAGVAEDAYTMASKLFGWLKGGLVLVTIGACGIFAAATGSSVAEAAAMGKIAIPEMRKHGYDIRLATGSVACAGTVGLLIPPSISLVIYGIATYESIGKLFIAGILPGILSVIIYIVMVYVRASINPRIAPTVDKAEGGKEIIFALSKGWRVFLIFFTIIGGLYSGVGTPEEVGTIGCFMSLLMVIVRIIKGKSTFIALKAAVMETAKLCAMIFAFVIGAGLFSLFITAAGVVPLIVDFITNLHFPPLLVLAVICFLYLPLGMFFDPLAMILVTVPIVYPIVVQELGYDPIWFGIIIVKMVEISVITPPMGINLYVIKGLYPEIELKDIMTGSLWFLVMDLVTIVILIAFPSICTYLPSLMK
jgi:C4-dicarboxylate transporter DctM subunit